MPSDPRPRSPRPALARFVAFWRIGARWTAAVAGLLLALAAMPGPAGAATPRTDAVPAPDGIPLRVLFVGNSLTYVNNLPRLVQALAASQAGGPRILPTTYVAAGGSLSGRWEAGAAARALRAGHWDALVLQESSGLPGCLAIAERRRERHCRESEIAHRRFADLARARGIPVLLLTTWGPAPEAQRRIDQGYDRLAALLRHRGVDCRLVPAARALDRYAREQGRAAARPDGLHPSLPASLVMAAQLYAAISGRQPRPAELVIDFQLLPVVVPLTPGVALEAQPQFLGVDRTYRITAPALAPLLAVAAAAS